MNLPFVVKPVNGGYILQSSPRPETTILDSRDIWPHPTLDTIEMIARNLNDWYCERYTRNQYRRDAYED